MSTIRDQIAKALREPLDDSVLMHTGRSVGDIASARVADELADAFLPLIEQIAKERAADEIRAIAHRLDDNGEESAAVSREGAAYVHRVLCDCAHALDGKP